MNSNKNVRILQLASDPGIRYFPFDGGNDFFIALLFFVKNLALDRRGTCPIAAS